MFGRGKINFETPNVIDPGDLPPSRPARVVKERRDGNEEDHNNELMSRRGHRPNYTDQVDHRTLFKKKRKSNLLSRTIKLDCHMIADVESNPQGDAYDDLNPAADDPEFGGSSPSRTTNPNADRSPTLDNARLFAATLLAETERRGSSRDLTDDDLPPRSKRTAMKWPRRGRRNEFRGLHRATTDQDEIDHIHNFASASDGLVKSWTASHRRWCRRGMVILAAIAIAIAIAVVVTFAVMATLALQDRKVASSDENDSSGRLQSTIQMLSAAGITDQDRLLDLSSPQFHAAQWMATQDAEQVDIPANLAENPYHFVQRYVLATLYFALGGTTQWIDSLNFVSDLHECSWFKSVPDAAGELFAVGVSCDENLQVRNLLIPSNNLNGQLPSEISRLTQLDFLSLKHNDLTGAIPNHLKQLTLLDYLDLKYNQLTGTIPDFLGNLSRLEVLGLSKNKLTGQLPASLGALHLKTLAIDDNQLTGDLSPVSLMTHLQYLYAENNNFQGALDTGLLADLLELVEVDLSGNAMEATSLPLHLFSHPSLRILDLHDNLLAGEIPENLPQNSVLEYLSLRENNIPSTIPEQVFHLSALTHLDLEANALTGTLPASALSQMTGLSYLFLGKNPLTAGTIPDELRSLRSLRELSMDALQLTGKVPAWIENFSQLKVLDLRTNELTGKVPIDFTNLSELSYLMLNSNLLTGPVPQGLGESTNLLVVSLHHNGILGEAGGLCSASSEVQLLTTDCGDIICPCCEECCDSEDCLANVLWDALEHSEGDWEANFKRSSYSFNPHILYDDRGASPSTGTN